MTVRKKAEKKAPARKKTARKKTAPKKAARKKPAPKKKPKAADSDSSASEGFFILLDAPTSPAAADTSLKLPADCRVDHIAELHQRLITLLSEGSALRLDLRDVKHFDGASLQLLFAFARDATDAGVTVDWKNVPGEFSKSAASLGLTAHLPTDQGSDDFRTSEL